METYGKILVIAMPAFIVLVLLEKWYGWRKGEDTTNSLDMISSLASGITNVTKDVLGLALVVVSYPLLLKHLALLSIPNQWIVYIIAFLALDFSGYVVHRLQHKINFFWNGHLVHHSSEEFNLACALRQSISSIVKLFAIFLFPAAILGVPAQVIGVVAPIHLFAQFWYHTRHIKKMGFLEKIIVTPSHHRVHHAINPQYLDKNFGQIFIFWDKWFGSFQEELEEVPPVYGITRPVQTWNPIKINFQHVGLLIQDAWRTKYWKEKFTLWFKPTGYRPADVAEKYPVHKIENVYHFEKYQTPANSILKIIYWLRFFYILILISYFFGYISYINSLNSSFIYLYGLYVFVYIYALTELMNRSKEATVAEFILFFLTLYIFYSQKDWFGIQSRYSFAIPVILVCTGLSLMATLYFGFGKKSMKIA